MTRAKAPVARATKPSRKPAAKEASHRHETITVDVRESVAIVTLARPSVHNPSNATLIRELTRVLAALDGDAGVRAVVLLGEGKSFCAGADLNWMKEMAGYDEERNLADAKELAWMLRTLYLLGKEVTFGGRRFISAVQGMVNDKVVFEANITGMVM
mgnify:CR=1 FL=1